MRNFCGINMCMQALIQKYIKVGGWLRLKVRFSYQYHSSRIYSGKLRVLVYLAHCVNYTQHAFARGFWRHAFRKILKIFSPEIESGTSFDGTL